MEQNNQSQASNSGAELDDAPKKQVRPFRFFLALLALGLANYLIANLLFFGLVLIFFGNDGLTILVFSLQFPWFFILETLIFSWGISRLIKKVSPIRKNFLSIFLMCLLWYVIITISPVLYYSIRLQENYRIQQAEDPEAVLSPSVKQLKTYDFSQSEIPINLRRSGKTELAIENNKVVWVDQTDLVNNLSTPFDIFLFEFDEQTSLGTRIQVSDFSEALFRRPKSVLLSDGDVYWTQDGNLYVYDQNTGQPTLLLEAIGSIYGKHQNWVLVSHASNLGSVFIKEEGTYLHNLSDGSEQKIDNSTTVRAVQLDEHNICYVTSLRDDITFPRDNQKNNFQIWQLNVLSNQRRLISPNLILPKVPDDILACRDGVLSYIVTTNSTIEKGEKPSLISKIVVYNIDDKEILYEISLPETQYENRQSLVGKHMDDKLYFSAQSGEYSGKITEVDLRTSVKKIILDEATFGQANYIRRFKDSFRPWDISDDYIVYEKVFQMVDNQSIFLKKLNK